MDLSEVKEKVVSTINQKVPKDERKNDAWMSKSLSDLQVDSLTMAEIVFDLEDAFGIDIEWEKMDPNLMKMKAIDACNAMADFIHPVILEKQAKAA